MFTEYNRYYCVPAYSMRRAAVYSIDIDECQSVIFTVARNGKGAFGNLTRASVRKFKINRTHRATLIDHDA
jgi:hypothetical protein